MISRRSVLAGSVMLSAASLTAPRIALARASGHRNLLFILLRGGADGMEMVGPVGDPDLTGLRPRWPNSFEGGRALDSFFTLNPSLAQIGDAYSKGEVLFVHATATSYRERSHFDGQNLLETGGSAPYVTKDGWLNRLVGMMPSDSNRALAIASNLPLALRGFAPASHYSPSTLPDASEDFMQRVSRLYAEDDQLAGLWQSALDTQAMVADTSLRNLRDAHKTGELTASLMNGPDGARVAMIELDGWDSHANQMGMFRRSAARLDALVGAYRTGMGEAWQDTMVLVATEFGRTAKFNGTVGTDHGTGGAAIVMGGSVKGGQVHTDWPGLRQPDLYEARDLMPTTPLESVLAGTAAEHLGLDPDEAMVTLFPQRQIKPLTGFVRS